MTVDIARLPGLLDGLDLIRADFPILARTMADGHPLVYLDSANTSQKPQVVIDAMVDHLERHNANVARAMHQLGAESTAGFEGGRDKVAAFLNAPSRDEVIFTKNASEAVNLVANTLAWADRPAGDRSGRRGADHGDGAPLQHRAVAAAHRAQGRHAALVRADRRRPARPVEHRRADHRAHQGRLADLGVQHARHRQPGRGDHPPCARGRGRRARRRRAGGAADAGRRAGRRRGLPGLHRPQGHRPDRHRRAVGPPVRARAAAAVPRRRRDDRDRGDGAVDVRRHPAQVRGRHAADRRGRRSRRGARLPRRRGHGQRPRARGGDHRLRPRGARHRQGPDRARPAGRGDARAERSPSRSTASTRTT